MTKLGQTLDEFSAPARHARQPATRANARAPPAHTHADRSAQAQARARAPARAGHRIHQEQPPTFYPPPPPSYGELPPRPPPSILKTQARRQSQARATLHTPCPATKTSDAERDGLLNSMPPPPSRLYIPCRSVRGVSWRWRGAPAARPSRVATTRPAERPPFARADFQAPRVGPRGGDGGSRRSSSSAAVGGPPGAGNLHTGCRRHTRQMFSERAPPLPSLPGYR